MLFAHDTEQALQSAAALVNSPMADTAELDAFVTQQRWTGRHRGDLAELEAVRALQPALRRLWELDEDGVATVVNALLGQARPQLVAHDDFGYHVHASPPDAPLADRMAVEAAMALVDVVRQGELERLRTCDAAECEHVLVDLSRNRSRRYCSAACANRINVAAFRARRGPGPRTPSGPA